MFKFPFPRLADDFDRAARARSWRQLGRLVDRNLSEAEIEIRSLGARPEYPIPVAGTWHTIGGGGASTNPIVRNTEHAAPIWIPYRRTYDRIGIRVSTADINELVRLGIRTMNASNRPGTVVLDAGTVDATTTGEKEITISTSLARGWYFLCAVRQGAGGGTASFAVNSVSGTGPFVHPTDTEGRNMSSGALGYTQTNVTGALPETFTVSGLSSSAPRVAIRAA